jgi:hypothetical protein
MARRKNRKQIQAKKEEQQARQFFMIAGISVAVILLILFLVYQNV